MILLANKNCDDNNGRNINHGTIIFFVVVKNSVSQLYGSTRLY